MSPSPGSRRTTGQPGAGRSDLTTATGTAAESAPVPADGTADPLSGLTSTRRLATRVAAFVVALLLVALAIRSLPGLGDIRARLAEADGAGIALIALLELGSVLGFVAALRGAFSNIPPWRVAVALGTAEQGANVLLPAGGVGGLALGPVAQRSGVRGGGLVEDEHPLHPRRPDHRGPRPTDTRPAPARAAKSPRPRPAGARSSLRLGGG